MGDLYEVMAGEHARHVRLMELIKEGANYMRVAFAWVAPGKSRAAPASSWQWP